MFSGVCAPVIATMRMWLSVFRARSRLQTSKPSIPGIMRSSDQGMRAEGLHLRARFEAVIGDLKAHVRRARADQLRDQPADLPVIVDDQHALRTARGIEAGNGTATARKLLHVAQKKTAMPSWRRHRPKQSPRGPLPHGDRVDHQQAGNLIGREVRLL